MSAIECAIHNTAPTLVESQHCHRCHCGYCLLRLFLGLVVAPPCCLHHVWSSQLLISSIIPSLFLNHSTIVEERRHFWRRWRRVRCFHCWPCFLCSISLRSPSTPRSRPSTALPRPSMRLDGCALVCFDWRKMRIQANARYALFCTSLRCVIVASAMLANALSHRFVLCHSSCLLHRPCSPARGSSVPLSPSWP